MKRFEAGRAAFGKIARRIQDWSRTAPELSKRTLMVGLLLCCMLALGLRALRLYAEPVLSRDGLKYMLNAQMIRDRVMPPEEIRPSPHYFYAKYLSCRLFGLSPHRLGVATNIVLGSLLPLLFFGIAKSVFRDGEIALGCALLGAIHPKLVAYSIEVQREIPYMFFCGLFFLFAVWFYQSRKWFLNAAMAGTAALSLCFRYEGAELLLFAMALHLLCIFRPVGGRRNAWFAAAGFAALFAVFFAMLLWMVDVSPAGAVGNAGKKLLGYSGFSKLLK